MHSSKANHLKRLLQTQQALITTFGNIVTVGSGVFQLNRAEPPSGIEGYPRRQQSSDRFAVDDDRLRDTWPESHQASTRSLKDVHQNYLTCNYWSTDEWLV